MGKKSNSIVNDDSDYINQFIGQFKQGSQCEQLSFVRSNNLSYEQSQILLHCSSNHYGKQQNSTTVMLDKSGKKSTSHSTIKYRQKQKKKLQELQDDVKALNGQIADAQANIQQAKDNILSKLQQLSKAKLKTSDNNSQIFHEIETLISTDSSGEQQQFVDVDKITLLIDTLRARIGPNGHQRQSKIHYHFKSLINILLPALHRYLMKSADKRVDMFSADSMIHNQSWTQTLYTKCQINAQQLYQIRKLSSQLNLSYSSSIRDVHRLTQIKNRLMSEGTSVQSIQDQISPNMNIVQCSKWILFCEKYKYRKELSLNPQNFFSHNNIEEYEPKFRKLVKKQ